MNTSERAKQGLVTGCDVRQEWLLPWFYHHYRSTNPDLPLTFFDFGLSTSARLFGQQRMEIVPFTLSPSIIAERESFPTPPYWPNSWHERVISQRKIWFTKAFALSQSPYLKTVWVDLDCQLCAQLSPIFDFLDTPAGRRSGLACALDAPSSIKRWKQARFLHKQAVGFQSGVLVYHHTSPLLHAWLAHCRAHHTQEYSEQSALNHTILTQQLHPAILPPPYNHLVLDQPPPSPLSPQIKILHYGGERPKLALMRQIF